MFVGPYHVGRTIGQGIFAKVKLGEDEDRRKVAIKVFDKRSSRSDPQLKQIEREINALRICDHPNIAKFVEVLEAKNRVYLVMEYISGPELYEYIHQCGRLSEKEAAFLFYQLCSAVQHCHSKFLAHRDLKPENILLAPLEEEAPPEAGQEPPTKYTLKLVDFGLANFFHSQDPGAQVKDIEKEELLKTQCGSPHYAAPEVLLGRDYKGREVDVWSLGIILYAMLCGRLPFHAPTIPQLTRKIVDGRFSFPSHLPELPRDLIRNMLRVHPSRRVPIAQILAHPFFKQYNAHLQKLDRGVPPPEPRLSVAAPQAEIEVDVGSIPDGGPTKPSKCRTCGKMLGVRRSAGGYVFLSTSVNVGVVKQLEGQEELCTCPAVETEPHDEEIEEDGEKKGKKGKEDKRAGKPPVKGMKNIQEDLFRACESGQVVTVRQLIEESSAAMTSGMVTREGQTLDLNARTVNNWTCLHYAAAMGHAEVIEALLTSMHPLQINAMTNENFTAVMLAADRGHLACVKLLLGYGASIHLANKDGKTAVFLAREKGFSEVAQLITEVSSLRREKAAGNPKLALKKQFFAAAEDGELDRIKHMLSLSINHLQRPDKEKESPEKDGKDAKAEEVVTVSVAEKGLDNCTALHLAARKGHTNVVHYLLTFSASLPPGSEGLDVNAPTKNGWTPLMLTADRGHAATTELLLKMGGNPYSENGVGKNTFQIATEAGHAKVVKVLNAAVEADSSRYARLKKKQEDSKKEKEAKSPGGPGGGGGGGGGGVKKAPGGPPSSPVPGSPDSRSGMASDDEPVEHDRSLVLLP